MKAFILAAGEGTRLRPLTNHQPKCLVSLKGKPLLVYQIDALRAAGVNDITIIGGYKSQALEIFGLPVITNPDFAITNMVYSLSQARNETGDDALLVYGDTAYEPRIISTILDAPGTALTIDTRWRDLWQGRMPDPLSDAETLRVDANGNLIEIGNRPTSFSQIQGQYMGLVKIAGGDWAKFWAHFDAHPGKSRVSMTAFLQSLIDEGWKIRAIPVEHGWLEVDSIADLEFYESDRLPAELFHF